MTDDPSSLWPSLIDDFGPPSPKLWAWAVMQQGRPAAQGPTSEGQAAALDGGASDEAGGAPAHLIWADAVANVGRPPADTAPGGAASADEMDQEAIPASSVAVPAAATVPATPASAGSQAQPPAASVNPSGQFLRPELSGGPDRLVAALAGEHPNHNPFGFIVDPRTGSVSRWRYGGDPLHPDQPTLEPVGPQEKQNYLEWLTGARANYPLGGVSPEEQIKRYQLQQGALPGAKGPPISATASGRTVTYKKPDGSTFTVSGVPPVRDINPLDIDWTAFAVRHGAIGKDGRHAIFPSEDQAYRASMALMSSMAANGKEWPGYAAGTLANIVRQWSPPGENNTEHMIKQITDMTGLDRSARWEALTPDQKDAFARAYERVEGYKGLAPDLPVAVR